MQSIMVNRSFEQQLSLGSRTVCDTRCFVLFHFLIYLWEFVFLYKNQSHEYFPQIQVRKLMNIFP